MKRFWLIYKLPIAIFVAFMFVFLALYQSWIGTRATRNQAAWVLHAALVLSKTEEVLRDSVDYGSSVRRLVIVRENQPYRTLARNARQSLVANLAALRTLVADNAQQQKRVAYLASLTTEHVATFDHLIDVYDHGGRQPAMDLLQDDIGRHGLDAIHDQASMIRSAERQILGQRSADFESLVENQSGLIILSVTGAFILALSTIAVINEQLRQLLKTQERLNDLNRGLEAKIDDRVRDLVAATTEIDQRRVEAEFEKSRAELLLRDVNHSVGNNLAMVSSFLSLQANGQSNPEVKEIIERARQRIQGIATAQRRLRFEQDAELVDVSATLNEVVKDLFESIALPGDVELKISILPVSISPRDVMSLSIILGELLVNALKHAFGENGNGLVTVGLRLGRQGLELVVEDNGSGMDVDSISSGRTGLGHTIVSRMVNQYGGDAVWEAGGNSGTRVTAPFPKMRFVTVG
jgi:two-component sensor histidine kinase